MFCIQQYRVLPLQSSGVLFCFVSFRACVANRQHNKLPGCALWVSLNRGWQSWAFLCFVMFVSMFRDTRAPV